LNIFNKLNPLEETFERSSSSFCFSNLLGFFSSSWDQFSPSPERAWLTLLDLLDFNEISLFHLKCLPNALESKMMVKFSPTNLVPSRVLTYHPRGCSLVKG